MLSSQIDIIIRHLSPNDYFKGYFDLLEQLTVVDKEDINFNQFNSFINNLSNNHKIYIIEYNNQIVATGTILIEQKIIHDFGKVAHIEDIVVDSSKRGYGFGKKIITYLVNIFKNLNCYKIILDCSDSNIDFYKKCGFKKKENQMALYLN